MPKVSTKVETKVEAKSNSSRQATSTIVEVVRDESGNCWGMSFSIALLVGGKVTEVFTDLVMSYAFGDSGSASEPDDSGWHRLGVYPARVDADGVLRRVPNSNAVYTAGAFAPEKTGPQEWEATLVGFLRSIGKIGEKEGVAPRTLEFDHSPILKATNVAAYRAYLTKEAQGIVGDFTSSAGPRGAGAQLANALNRQEARVVAARNGGFTWAISRAQGQPGGVKAQVKAEGNVGGTKLDVDFDVEIRLSTPKSKISVDRVDFDSSDPPKVIVKPRIKGQEIGIGRAGKLDWCKGQIEKALQGVAFSAACELNKGFASGFYAKNPAMIF
jgi:hypothetical protein